MSNIKNHKTPTLKKERSSTSIRKKAMLQALKSSLGIISTACKAAGIDRKTHRNWLKNDEKYSEAVDDIFEDSGDFAENSLFTQIKNLNTTATIFYLKTIHKNRGYVETPKVVLQERPPDEFDDYTDAELLEIANNGYKKRLT